MNIGGYFGDLTRTAVKVPGNLPKNPSAGTHRGLDLIFLKIQSENGGLSRVAINQFPATIGRDPGNQIAIPDDQISRFHLRIKRRGRLLIVEDLDSRNGTFLNGDRIVNAVVRTGDKILIGSTEIVVFSTDAEISLEQRALDGQGLQEGPEITVQPARSGENEPDLVPSSRIPLQPDPGIPVTGRITQAIYEAEGDMVLSRSAEDAGRTVLKALHRLLPWIRRSAIFQWHAESRKLTPLATRGQDASGYITVIQKPLEDAINRVCGIFVGQKSEHSTPGRTQAHQESARFVLPVVTHERITALVHVEVDPAQIQDPHQQIQPALALIERVAPTLENFSLRSELDGWLIGVIDTLVATIEAKDTYTHGHSERVSRYSLAIADELKLGRDLKRQLLISALCHDIGKIGVPDAVLKKASLLSTEEYLEMKLHPVLGAEIVQRLPGSSRFLSGIKYHHERWDGSGYPDGLRGEDIPFFGRIVGICDVFDAMVSGRAYSGFMDQSDAVERLQEEKELFDPEILKAFNRAHDRGTLTIKTSTRQNRGEPERSLLKIEIEDSTKEGRKRR
jgi:HD-GYP domain-containing protein (c-di-GMP phosphodiesterase class II)